MNLFSFIKERISILDVVNEYVTLKRAGGYHKGNCPFHHEKTASFTVSPDKEIFYCFGCHVSGDVIAFIAKIENCSQRDAAKILADRYGVELPSTLSHEATEKNIEQKNHYFNICSQFASWCHAQLLKSPTTLNYLAKRGFGNDIISHFTLGYFPGGHTGINNLLSAAKKQSILAQDLIDAHIIAQGRTTLYSPFEERIIFPIKDGFGRCCGFGGRIFKDNDTRPKYYNSRENEYFEKGSLLFGLDKAKKSIQETGIVFLVEGYTDCMAMVKHNIPNTVATLGTACTQEHLKILSRLSHYLYIAYDGDDAGHQALLRLTQLCFSVNLEPRVIQFPAGEDPASFLMSGTDIEPLINKAKDIFLFFIESQGKNFINRPLSQKMQVVRSLLVIITSLSDSLKKDILLQMAAKTFDIPFESLKNEASRVEMKEEDGSQKEPAEQTSQEDTTLQQTLEKRIFCAIIHDMGLLNKRTEHILIKYLPDPLRGILLKLKKVKETQPDPTFFTFFDILDAREQQSVSRFLIETNEKIDIATFDNLLTQLQKKEWKIIVHDIKIQLDRARKEGDTQKISDILHNFMELQNTFVVHKTQEDLQPKGDKKL